MDTCAEGELRSPGELRSARWLGRRDLKTFGHLSRLKQMGYAEEDFEGRPVIAVVNTWSDINPCHTHFRERVQDVKRGVLQAGGFPLELPALALAENFQKPSTMMYRNLLAMETEELLRSYPVDGVVLMGGCDKTTPGLLMGAASMDLPAVFLPAGPMMRGCWRGQTLGSGSDAWKHWDEYRAGNIGECELKAVEGGIARTPGHCMTMGTASTMTAVAEAMGFSLPGASSIPAVMAEHGRMAAACGRTVVTAVAAGRRPSAILGADSVHNGVVTALALGGSTNAVIHVIAMARRVGIPVGAEVFEELAERVPLLADVRPAGTHLMEDFYDAGGLPALLESLRDLLRPDAPTVNGRTLGENIAGARVHLPAVIRPREEPVSTVPALRVLRGNLCPDGALIKPSAMDPGKMRHTGRALVFDDYTELKRSIDDPATEVDEDTVLVLRGAGPVGGPGMPEWGMLPLPKRLLEKGVRDLVRISDARMSGTSYGTCVLHVAPESAVGGPLAALRTRDLVDLDVRAGTLDARVPAEEWEGRLAEVRAKRFDGDRGYLRLYRAHVGQADAGCDFDFLAGVGGPEPEIH
ncbi:IlvD/Edd family dehydratase [Brevibacterium album]|uniref:IlvD/Edd family dehydratase n=1 Tax=Brevibacterium album TaxID=417948 RepID=UPI001FDF048F|nr:IlvD/Edd family dehydratase [Brevibacterium album]